MCFPAGELVTFLMRLQGLQVSYKPETDEKDQVEDSSESKFHSADSFPSPPQTSPSFPPIASPHKQATTLPVDPSMPSPETKTQLQQRASVPEDSPEASAEMLPITLEPEEWNELVTNDFMET